MHQVVSTARRLALLPVAALSLAGCFTSTADFREEAETFIVEDPGIASALDVTLVSATCAEPADQDVGTTFACTAIDESGATWSTSWSS